MRDCKYVRHCNQGIVGVVRRDPILHHWDARSKQPFLHISSNRSEITAPENNDYVAALLLGEI